MREEKEKSIKHFGMRMDGAREGEKMREIGVSECMIELVE